MKKQIVLGAATATLIAAMSAGSAFALSASDLVGEQASNATPERTIRLDNGARYINVNYGEIVRIEQGGKTFAWDFDGKAANFKLSQIAPQSFAAADVTVYVNQAEDPIVGQASGE